MIELSVTEIKKIKKFDEWDDQVFSFEHVKFEMNVRHTNGDVKLVDVYTYGAQRRGISWRLKMFWYLRY